MNWKRTPLDAVIDYAGSARKLAQALGFASHTSITHWKQHFSKIPFEHALRMEQLTAGHICADELRPDLRKLYASLKCHFIDQLTKDAEASRLWIPIDKIKVAEHFHREPGDIAGLATDIVKRGLLQPIGLDYENNLLFGWRRLLAVQSLGHERIHVLYIDAEATSDMAYADNAFHKPYSSTEKIERYRRLQPCVHQDVAAEKVCCC